ncbi:hypothetical protein LTR04_002252 [Oleoguttula sp. CCFEE 6159]|nr:hypothetical protein LTR04_002252 [Oleoguttula sp. CCFEE 6159]
MASSGDSLQHSPFSGDPHNGGIQKSIPILSSSAASTVSSPGDLMDVAHPNTASMGPPLLASPNGDRSAASHTPAGLPDITMNGSSGTGTGASAAAQQPKFVQTAFIHKLYNMLEDQSIQHLISWSNTNESFVMSPSSEFSKVLASYFKHTNISSFVRQLNMYGFHKVSDVFHTGAPDSPLWEFKHGNGSFKRGDLVGLREIKRRASRHALIHRDSFSGPPKLPLSQPATPIETPTDPVEARLNRLEYNLHDIYARLWNHELSSHVLSMIPDPDNPIHKDSELWEWTVSGIQLLTSAVALMQRDIARQTEMLRSMEDPHESFLPGRQPFVSNASLEPAMPVSPRQYPQDDHRRPSLMGTSRPASFRAPVPSHLANSPRRYGMIGSGAYSPSSARSQVHPNPPPPPAPQPQHPLASTHSLPASLSRRHTSADIRLQGWQGQPPPPSHSPYASGQCSSQWPSSPHRTPHGDRQLRDALAKYELPQGPRSGGSRQTTPPLSSDNTPSGLGGDSGWALPGARYPFRGIDMSAPPTRRSSMASNVHSLLNPAETAERADEDEGQEERKRKRL